MNVKQLITHSGAFHADDVFAAAVFRLLVPDVPILRTRDPEVLAQAVDDPDIAVFDVGDHDDPARNNFDHHQRDFTRQRTGGLPYASIGLVWRVYGARCVSSVLDAYEMAATDGRLAQMSEYIDTRLIMAMDAADCGQLSVRGQWRPDREVSLDVLDISHLVSYLHPPRSRTAVDYDAYFLKAVTLAESIVVSACMRAYDYFAAADVVTQADDGSEIIVLQQYLPWYDHIGDHHRFVLSPAKSGEGWMVETVQDDFVPRCPLPDAWAGLRLDALAEVCGVDDAIFCHRARFIASARSLDGAVAMARRALAIDDA